MLSQVQVIGRKPNKTWDDYEQGCLDSFAGGHRSDGHLEAFQHGMRTVFSVLRGEFPPAELCKAAPGLLAACKTVLFNIGSADRLSQLLPHQLEFFAHNANSLLSSAVASAEVTQEQDHGQAHPD